MGRHTRRERPRVAFLALFGKLTRIEQKGVGVMVWIVQILGSAWWLRRFRYGPAEYVWRIVTNLQVPRMRIRSTSP